MAEPATKPKEATAAVKETAKAVEQHSRKIADSARNLKHSTERIETSAEITTRLAADRNILAAERTYAAWVRTGLFALASGVGARAVLTGVLPEALVLADASLLIAFSAFCFGAAIWRHLHPGPRPTLPHVKQIPRSALIGINGFLALVSLAALIGIWSTPMTALAPSLHPG
jgi:putative membrane protein